MAEVKKSGNKSSNSVKILYCKDCPPHNYQDRKYGYKQRVCNHAPVKGSNMNRYKCTVCSAYIQAKD